MIVTGRTEERAWRNSVERTSNRQSIRYATVGVAIATVASHRSAPPTSSTTTSDNKRVISRSVVARGPYLRDRLRLDLADPFARDRQPPPDLLERELAIEAEAVPQPQHLAFALVERRHRAFDLLGQLVPDRSFLGRMRRGVANEVSERRLLIAPDRGLERCGMSRRVEEQLDLADRHFHARRELIGTRIATEFRRECGARPIQLAQRLHDVDRQPDGASVVGDGAPDVLPDPPRGIRRELEAATILKAVDRLHQADVAFLNQIEERQPSTQIALRDRDDQAEVGFDELALRVDEHLLLLADPREPLLEDSSWYAGASR